MSSYYVNLACAGVRISNYMQMLKHINNEDIKSLPFELPGLAERWIGETVKIFSLDRVIQYGQNQPAPEIPRINARSVLEVLDKSAWEDGFATVETGRSEYSTGEEFWGDSDKPQPVSKGDHRRLREGIRNRIHEHPSGIKPTGGSGDLSAGKQYVQHDNRESFKELVSNGPSIMVEHADCPRNVVAQLLAGRCIVVTPGTGAVLDILNDFSKLRFCEVPIEPSRIWTCAEWDCDSVYKNGAGSYCIKTNFRNELLYETLRSCEALDARYRPGLQIAKITEFLVRDIVDMVTDNYGQSGGSLSERYIDFTLEEYYRSLGHPYLVRPIDFDYWNTVRVVVTSEGFFVIDKQYSYMPGMHHAMTKLTDVEIQPLGVIAYSFFVNFLLDYSDQYNCLLEFAKYHKHISEEDKTKVHKLLKKTAGTSLELGSIIEILADSKKFLADFVVNVGATKDYVELIQNEIFMRIIGLAYSIEMRIAEDTSPFARAGTVRPLFPLPGNHKMQIVLSPCWTFNEAEQKHQMSEFDITLEQHDMEMDECEDLFTAQNLEIDEETEDERENVSVGSLTAGEAERYFSDFNSAMESHDESSTDTAQEDSDTAYIAENLPSLDERSPNPEEFPSYISDEDSVYWY